MNALRPIVRLLSLAFALVLSAPCVSVVVALLDQAAGSQTMQRIGWAQPEAIPAEDCAPPCRGAADGVTHVPGSERSAIA